MLPEGRAAAVWTGGLVVPGIGSLVVLGVGCSTVLGRGWSTVLGVKHLSGVGRYVSSGLRSTVLDLVRSPRHLAGRGVSVFGRVESLAKLALIDHQCRRAVLTDSHFCIDRQPLPASAEPCAKQPGA